MILGVKHQPIFTLENPQRSTTVDSRIPAGTYQCGPYSSPKFPNVWEITKVPERTAILIHAGNTEKDTTGCVLVGLSATNKQIGSSRDAMAYLEKFLGKNNFVLEIKD